MTNENDDRVTGSPEYEAVRVRAIDLATRHGLPYADYLVDLFDNFEPEAYRDISDADLVEDIRSYDNEAFPGIYPE